MIEVSFTVLFYKIWIILSLMSVKKHFWKCQNMPEYAGFFREMPVNASGMDFTHKCRYFPNPAITSKTYSVSNSITEKLSI